MVCKTMALDRTRTVLNKLGYYPYIHLGDVKKPVYFVQDSGFLGLKFETGPS